MKTIEDEFNQLSKKTTKELTNQLKETLAAEARNSIENNKRFFTAAEMWNQQRKSRSAASMLRKWNMN
jgi:hypothetical protein